MRIEAGSNTIVLTPVTGEPTEPGRYLALVPRYPGQGEGLDPALVEFVRDGRTGGVFPDRHCAGAVWAYRVTVEAGPAGGGPE